MKDKLRIAVVNMTPGSKKANLLKMESLIQDAYLNQVEMLLFPEMCLTGYDMYISPDVSQDKKIEMAETLDGPSVKRIEKLAEKYNMYIIFGMPEQEGFLLFNSAVVIGPNGIIGSYRKIHPFGPELDWCEKGDKPFIFDTPWGKVGLGICYDTYQFPELLRYYTYKGCRLYLNPTALLEETSKEGSRDAFLKYYTTALEYAVMCNTVYVASSNLTGCDITNTFGGASVIIGPAETPFYETYPKTYVGNYNSQEEGLFYGSIDLSLATRRLCIPRRQSGTPDFRPDLYAGFYKED